jgi:hypothetical protein
MGAGHGHGGRDDDVRSCSYHGEGVLRWNGARATVVAVDDVRGAAM